MNMETPLKVEARRGFSVSYKGKTLLSTIDPVTQSERVIAAAHRVPRTLFFCPSPLYGYGLEKLLEIISNDSAVLCIEADETLMQFTRREISPELIKNQKFRLIHTRDPQALCTYIKTEWGARAFRRIEILHITGGWQLYPEIYQSLSGAVQRDIAIDWGNAITLMNLGRRYALNFFRNLPLLGTANSAETIHFGSRPVLVLGAGPSLDDFLEVWPPDFSERDSRPFAVICVDTALTALKARNIQPDLVVALEAQHWNLRDFIGMDGWQIPIAMDLSALPATREQLGGGCFLFMTPWTGLSIFDRLNHSGLTPLLLLPLGSVGLTAVALALKLSSGIVVTAGLDFSFNLDSFHAGETPSQVALLRNHCRLTGIIHASGAFKKGVFKTTAKNSTTVYTDPGLQNYRDLFEQEFSREDRLRDINSPGLPLGIKTVPLQESMGLLSNGPPSGKTNFSSGVDEKKRIQVNQFIQDEHHTLLELKAFLTGEKNPQPGELEVLLDKADYLWAHFPDYAGTSGKRPGSNDISFLKRVRFEIDPFLKIFEMILGNF